MFGVDPETFLKSLTKPRVKVGTEWVSKGQNQEQVLWAVNSITKGLYARVFHWLVKKCNLTLDQQGTPRDYFIGVLDIAGFEIFDVNIIKFFLSKTWFCSTIVSNSCGLTLSTSVYNNSSTITCSSWNKKNTLVRVSNGHSSISDSIWRPVSS
jgi:hypothetical protein